MCQKLIQKIIPYCSENFITVPLWEEGDYRIQINLWYVAKLKLISIEDFTEKLEDIIHKLSNVNPDFDIFYDIDTYRPQDERAIYELKIKQKCDYDDGVANVNFILNHNVEQHLELAVTLMEKLQETNT